VRHGDQADTTVILTALGVDMAGNKEVLAALACAEESKDGWVSVLEDLRARGATQMDLIVTDGHEGRLSAVQALFPVTPRQRCLLHKQRNVPPRYPQASAPRRRDRTAGYLGTTEQGECFDPPCCEHSPNMASCIQRQ
jgi:putative transposase